METRSRTVKCADWTNCRQLQISAPLEWAVGWKIARHTDMKQTGPEIDRQMNRRYMHMRTPIGGDVMKNAP
jgi:hypothetical protein